MKKTLIFITSFLIVSCGDNDTKQLNGGPHSGQLISERHLYEFSSVIKAIHDSTKNNDDAAISYSNIGDYFSSLKAFEFGYEPDGNSLVVFDTSKFYAIPAIDLILETAKKNQIIIINEGHHVPYHRFFTILLLNKLYEEGFRYFGAETLNSYDTLINKRKYPIINSGYYSSEPQYGNMLRLALKTGFTLFAYEPVFYADSVMDGTTREIKQARNIEQILKKDPNARIVIHCGYDHLIESDYPAWGKAMAGRLYEYTGIDPLTIDQVQLTEHYEKTFENPYYGKIENNNFVVLVPKQNMLPPNFRLNNSSSDIFVYHPRTHLKYNRPDWLYRFYSSKIINNEITISFPVLVKAYISTEDEKTSVPVDVIEIKNKTDTTALALIPNMTYKIIIENKAKNRQTLNVKL